MCSLDEALLVGARRVDRRSRGDGLGRPSLQVQVRQAEIGTEGEDGKLWNHVSISLENNAFRRARGKFLAGGN